MPVRIQHLRARRRMMAMVAMAIQGTGLLSVTVAYVPVTVWERMIP